jgi:DNA-binding CsgD family transcriptional regulator/tetratricopeptide (TPR) repeat protein
MTRWFVGREQESGTMLGLLEMASKGDLRVVLLGGEPGIGKTRLMQQIGEHASLRGARVLRGGASQSRGMPAYLPFLEALGPYLRTADPDLLREQTGQWAAALSTIFPELTTRLGELPAGYSLPSEQERLRLFEAVGVFLSEIATLRPLVLLFDDLQWSDLSTLDLLSYVTHSQPAARLLIVGAYREGEAEENQALQGTIAELTRQRRLTSIHVGPLPSERICELATKHMGGPIAPQVCRLLYSQSEGNPFFAEELLRGWVENGALIHEDGGWTISEESDLVLPPSIIGAVRQRLARLPTDVVDDLCVAAIIGRTFDLTVLAAATAQDPEAVEDRLMHASHAHLIEACGDGLYSFLHDRIRECLYALVATTKRRRLHSAIGYALEDRQKTRTAHRLAELAFHFARGEDRGRGVDYSRQAGDDAMRHWAIEEALAHYRTALDLLESDDEGRGDVLLQIGDAALVAGREEVAADSYQAAQQFLTKSDPVAAGRAAHGFGVARLRQDAVHETQAAFEAAITLLRGHRGSETVRVLADLATFLCVSLGRQEEGVAQGHLALDMAHELQDYQLEAAAGRTVGNLQVRGNMIPEGIRRLEQALALAQASDDLAEAGECHACLANAYYWSAEIEHAREHWLMREKLALRCQQPYELRHVYTWFAFLAVTQGDWEEANRQLARSQVVAERLASSEPRAFFHQVRGFLAWEQGDFRGAERELEAAIEIYRDRSPRTLAWYLGPLALVQLAVGKSDAALDRLVELDDLMAALPPGSLPTAPALVCAMLVAVRIGDRQRAARYHTPLKAFEGQLHWFLADRALAAYEIMIGDTTSAETHLDGAEKTARRAGMREMLRGILEDRAHLPRQARSGLPAGLSRREADVLRLVAVGRSNRDIARELHLSENTVAKHLTSIFNKTNSDNRAAAAAFALRNRLIE